MAMTPKKINPLTASLLTALDALFEAGMIQEGTRASLRNDARNDPKACLPKVEHIIQRSQTAITAARASLPIAKAPKVPSKVGPNAPSRKAA